MSYIELHAHSYFSLLDGAASPEALVAGAAALDMPALALTDHDAVYGAVRFVSAARRVGIQPLLGAELTFTDGAHLTLLVEDATGWANLCWLITQARQDAPKGEAALDPRLLEGRTQGLIALSGCRQGWVSQALLAGEPQRAFHAARRLRDWFGPDHLYLELQHHFLADDPRLMADLAGLAEHLSLPLVATNNVHYVARDEYRLQDVLVSIRHLTTLAECGALRRPNSEYYLKDARLIAPHFARTPEALTHTRRIAERCTFDLQYGLQDLPVYPVPEGLDAAAYLRDVCEAALPMRYPNAAARVHQQLAYELDIIQGAGLSNYFLVVWDIVCFARSEGIRCQGRGSAANSLVAYLLGISPIDPLAHDLVFERFLSPERQGAPDIDIDFDAARREEVIQYVYATYGAAHAAMACTFVTFRARSAIRDVGRALGFPPDLLDRAAKTLDLRHPEGIAESVGFQETFGELSTALPWQQLLDLARQIDGFPRHLGIHNGGMVLTGPPLTERVALEPATMPDRVVVQWDKEGLEDVGLIKIDILGLRMLSAISEAVAIVETQTGQALDLDGLTFDDPAVYDLICDADTVGVFQVESRAQATVLPRLKPRTFADIVVSIALIRPGPIQGNMVHPYLRRRLGEEEVVYPHPLLEEALGETLGVILFQEQVLKVARDLAGLTGGQGEQLRRALGSKRSAEAIAGLQDAFMAGALRKGVPPVVAENVFESLLAFGGYSFAKSHAAAFAVLVYQSAWFKRYHPAAFLIGLLNNQPMGFWSSSVLVGDAQRHGVEVRSVDINASGEVCLMEEKAVRLGLALVKGIGASGAERIVEGRGEMLYIDLADFCHRTHLPKRLVEHLILAGAMDIWTIPRRQLLWMLGKLRYPERELELEYRDEAVDLPTLSDSESYDWEVSMMGLSTLEHVMAQFREALTRQGTLSSQEVKARNAGEVVQVAGQIVVHQAPPTAKGYHFITIEDEFGLMDLVVRPAIYEAHRPVLRGHPLVVVQGAVQHQEGVINVLVQSAYSLLRSEVIKHIE